jgi:hypothetical protein
MIHDEERAFVDVLFFGNCYVQCAPDLPIDIFNHLFYVPEKIG